MIKELFVIKKAGSQCIGFDTFFPTGGATFPDCRSTSPNGRDGNSFCPAPFFLCLSHDSVLSNNHSKPPKHTFRQSGHPAGQSGHAAGDLGYTAGDLGPAAVDLGHPAGDLGHTTVDLCHTAGDLCHTAVDLCHAAGDLGHPAGDLGPAAGDLGHVSRHLGHPAGPSGHPDRISGCFSILKAIHKGIIPVSKNTANKNFFNIDQKRQNKTQNQYGG